MDRNFQMNLQCLSATSIVITIWEGKAIQKSMDRLDYSGDSLLQLRHLTKKAVKEVEELVLPIALKKKLMYMTKSFGLKIYYWRKFVCRFSHPKKLNMQKIYWTSCGKIDAVKIFESVWVGEPSFDIVDAFEIACNYCLEEYVDALWQAIPHNRKDFVDFDEYNTSIDYKHHLMLYWQSYICGELTTLTQQLYIHDPNNIYRLNQSPNENMLRLSALLGHELAFKYFWRKLTEEERQRNKLQIIHLLLPNHRNGIFTRYINNESNGYILTFIINQLSTAQKITLFRYYPRSLMTIFINIYPWNQFLLSILEQNQNYFSSDDYNWFIVEITTVMVYNQLNGIKAKNTLFQQALYQIWNTIAPETKQVIGTRDSYLCLHRLLIANDIQTLRLIFDDPVLAYKRHELIEYTAHSTACHKVLKMGNSCELMYEIIKSAEEKERFDKLVNLSWRTYFRILVLRKK